MSDQAKDYDYHDNRMQVCHLEICLNHWGGGVPFFPVPGGRGGLAYISSSRTASATKSDPAAGEENCVNFMMSASTVFSLAMLPGCCKCHPLDKSGYGTYLL